MRFVHTADWHIGKPFSRVEDSDRRSRLQQERIAAVRRLGDLARSQSAAFLVVAGDLFDTPTVSRATAAEALAAVGSLGLPVYAIPGNHDPGGAGTVWEQAFFGEEQARLAPNLSVLRNPEPVLVPGQAVLLPCPMTRRLQTDDPTAWLRSPDVYAALPQGIPRIVLAHGSVEGFSSAGDPDDIAVTPNLLELDRLPAPELDYIALGDWHGTRREGPRAWYCGTPELDRFPKGGLHDPGNALLVEIPGRGTEPAVQVHRVARFRWHQLAFSFGTDASLDQFRSACDELLGGRVAEDLLDLTLSGSLPLGQSRAFEDCLESLRARLLRLDVEGEVRFLPSDDELARLRNDPDNPLVAAVAGRLAEEIRSGDEEARAVAQLALRQLYAALEAEGDRR